MERFSLDELEGVLYALQFMVNQEEEAKPRGICADYQCYDMLEYHKIPKLGSLMQRSKRDHIKKRKQLVNQLIPNFSELVEILNV